MADKNYDIDTPSRLSKNSADFYKCSIAKNSPSTSKENWSGYIPGSEYLPGTPDTISDGDNRGRDPESLSADATIGTNIDISTRECSIAKNTPSLSDDGWGGYNCASQYCAGSDRV